MCLRQLLCHIACMLYSHKDQCLLRVLRSSFHWSGGINYSLFAVLVFVRMAEAFARKDKINWLHLLAPLAQTVEEVREHGWFQQTVLSTPR